MEKQQPKQCENCRYYYEEVCVNADSPEVTEFRLPDQTCKYWEDRVDAVPVVHGRWERICAEYLMLSKCSVCGLPSGSPSGSYAFNYCPQCGAKMDL